MQKHDLASDNVATWRGALSPKSILVWIFETIKGALEEAGASLDDVVRTRVLLRRIEDWEAVAKVRGEYFKAIRPVDTIMQITTCINPEWLVEIEADAVIDHDAV